jgi:M6 family metalloprotease-like protein
VLARTLGPGSIAAIVVLGCTPVGIVAQQYLKPVPTAPGVRIDARALANRDAARALGIPLIDDLPSTSHGRVHVEGARAVLVVLARFEDTPEPLVGADQVRAQMFTGTPTSKTLAEFYEDQSGGLFTVTGDVTDWLQTDVTLLEGAGSVEGHGLIGDSLRVHVARLLQQLDPVLDFGAFDNDGPDGVPNSGDDNGRVDLLSIKYAEVGGHCGGPGPWPHFGGVFVDGGPFESDDLAPNGTPITVPVYIMDSVVECDGTTPQSMSITAHELGHAIGLPDYYRAVEGIEAENRHWVVGCFDLMAAGGWGCGDGELPADGFGPTGFSAFSRWTLGWTELEEVTVATDQTFVLEPLSTSAHALRVRLAPESLESWIIEYRTREGFDAPLPADGVLIYHHDGFTGSRPTDPSLPPAYPFHLVEADGDNALRLVAAEGGNRGVAADVFARTDPSGPLGPATVPSTRDHLGGQSTLVIHEITPPGPTASVRLSVGTGFRVASREVPSETNVLQPMVGVIELADGQEPYVLAQEIGGLPDALVLALDGSTVTIQGTPRVAGMFAVSVWVEDHDGLEVAETIALTVLDDPSIDPLTLLGALVGAQSLTLDQLDYLDRSGNDDGSLDLGDLRAFVRRQPFD